jgi:hypothetical protein
MRGARFTSLTRVPPRNAQVRLLGAPDGAEQFVPLTSLKQTGYFPTLSGSIDVRLRRLGSRETV